MRKTIYTLIMMCLLIPGFVLPAPAIENLEPKEGLSDEQARRELLVQEDIFEKPDDRSRPEGLMSILSDDERAELEKDDYLRQKPGYEILLKSRTFTPEEIVSPQARGQGHVIMQFYDIPTQEEREALKAMGITLQDYIPNYAYVAHIETQDLDSLPDVRAIVPILPTDKISSHIQEDEWLDYALREDGSRYMWTQFHQDVSRQRAETLISEVGGELIDYTGALNIYSVWLTKEQAYALAGYDELQAVQEAMPMSEGNDGARMRLNVNELQVAPHNLDGTGVTVFVYDGGIVDSTHNDFGTRVTEGEATGIADHATHCAGTCCGDGTLSAGSIWRGMATNANVYSREFECGTYCFYNSTDGMYTDFNAAITNGMDLSTMSIISNIYRNGYPCAWEGDYELSTQYFDWIISGGIQSHRVIPLQCNGNERGNGAPCGQYGTIPQPAVAKNAISVGALNTNDNSMTTFSSWGPTDDGRLRPDVVGPGCQSTGDLGITSTVPVDTYDSMCGCSMATPAVAGGVALMIEHWRNENGNPNYLPVGATIKAILAQTATDLGNAGPDYQFGFGHVNISEAVDLITAHENGPQRVITDYIYDDDNYYYSFYVPPGVTSIKVTLAWDDPYAGYLSNPNLVNDLDLLVYDPNNVANYAYTLNPAIPANVAGTGFNGRDNLEQVEIPTPIPGKYRARVWGWNVVQAPQDFTLVLPYGNVQCGDILYEDTTLVEDLDCLGIGLEIGASYVDLDCSGYTIQGSDTSWGIKSSANSGSIVNCTIRDFDTGIYLYSVADQNDIINNHVLSNDAYGIYLNDAWSNLLQYNDVELNGYNGVYIYNNAKYNDIYDNDIEDNSWHGLQIVGSDYCDVRRNMLRSNSWSGLGLDSDHTTVIDNDAIMNSNYGFHIASSTGNHLEDNWAESNQRGIYLQDSNDNDLIDNYMYSNQYGIYLYYSDYNTISLSDMVENSNSGVYLYYSDSNNLTTTDFYQNQFGIRVFNSHLNNITDNDVRESADDSINLVSALYNRIEGNDITDHSDYGLYIYNSDYNDIIGNYMDGSTSTSWNVYILSSDNNDFIDNIINHPDPSDGIYHSTSFGTNFDGNTVCGGSAYDFYVGSGTYTADENSCDLSYQYHDDGQAAGCDFQCSGCRKPENDLMLTEDTTLCPGTYNIPDTGINGVIFMGANDVKLDCNGANLIGNGTGIGLYFFRANDSTIENCEVENYNYGIRIFDSYQNTVQNCDGHDNNYGMIFAGGVNNLIVNNTFCGNANNDISGGTGSSGNNNICTLASGWSDDGQTTSNCDWECDGCRNIEQDLSIVQDTTLCYGTYSIPDAGLTGVIRFGADSVTLDCADSTLTGDDTGAGISTNNHDYATIQNCNIDDYDYGIYASGTDGVHLEGNVLDSNDLIGIFLSSSSYGDVISNQVYDSGSYGISVSSSTNNDFDGNHLEGNDVAGFRFSSSNSNDLYNNVMDSNYYGAFMYDSNNNRLWTNEFINNTNLNAYENAGMNYWDHTSLGNYWSDLAANAGCPTQYYVTGPGSGVDNYPTGPHCVDNDEDGYGQFCAYDCTYVGIDCDDTDENINPGHPELCDGLDNDCNAGTEDGSGEAWYYVSCDGSDTDLCLEGRYECVSAAQYCTDNTGSTLDMCNGFDEDCNTMTPDGFDEVWYDDPCDGSDTDFCDEGAYYCDAGSQECSDTTGNNLESCNGFDDDCNILTEDGTDEPWLGDLCDGLDTDMCEEGQYECQSGSQFCTDTTGNDYDLCNGADDDCNPLTIDGFDEVWYGVPCDGPDYGLCEEGSYFCDAGSQECDDSSGDDYELCNGLDDDCNIATDDGVDEEWYGTSCDGPDSDLCEEGSYYCVAGSQECDDATGDTAEVCGNQIDDDCDGSVDEGCGGPDGSPIFRKEPTIMDEPGILR
ncbi:MAG: right-handed parallel beta-helix repeat-containing protein [Nanoarchaeota archaeon]|nr:right-handed parallel beta-helix repeat-containing protein [Nanoarchaeota archaeon]